MELYVLVEQCITLNNIRGTFPNSSLPISLFSMIKLHLFYVIFTFYSTDLRKCLNLTKRGIICLPGYETFLEQVHF